MTLSIIANLISSILITIMSGKMSTGLMVALFSINIIVYMKLITMFARGEVEYLPHTDTRNKL